MKREKIWMADSKGIVVEGRSALNEFKARFAGTAREIMVPVNRVIAIYARENGQGMALLYSLTGGLFAYAGMLALRRWFSGRRLWILSVFCAMAHNFGQLCAAALIARTRAVWYYLPVLLPAALLAGALTGLCTQLLLQRLGRAGLLPADKKQEEEANG